jgi:effector-binding domain-containing protein
MPTQLIHQPLTIYVYGFGGTASQGNWVPTLFKLMDRLWQTVRQHNLQSKGKNIWIYETDNVVFAGVEMVETPPSTTALEYKTVTLPQYAYHKHIGPYSAISQAGQAMKVHAASAGFEATLPYVEIYGHHSNDESKLETEIFWTIH